MKIEVKVPQLPESVAEATLVSWHKQPGQPVKRDENLIDIETDKVVLELPAPGDGVLVEVRKGDGSTVAGQEVIAVIDTEAKGAAAVAPVEQPAAAAGAAPEASAGTAPARPVPPPGPATSPAAASAAVTALPAARKLMEDRGVSATDVQGTGRGGRITKGDVLAATPAAKPAPASAPAAPAQ